MVTSTPLRVSLFGGGTDLPDYYRAHGGQVLSLTLDKYVHVAAKARWDGRFVLGYGRQGPVRSIDEIDHPITREVLRLAGVSSGIEIVSMSDAPAEGSGLGGSSAFTVGLLNAVLTLQGDAVGPARLAELACHVEIDLLGEPIGKQDQFAAAMGGCREYSFHADEDVTTDSVGISAAQLAELGANVLVFYTGVTRRASDVLRDQRAQMSRNLDHLHSMKSHVAEGRDRLMKGDFEGLGSLLRQSWERKKRLSKQIHNASIDHWYDSALAAGAYGGKLLGAGGGGFLFFLCPPQRQAAVRTALRELAEMPVGFSAAGTEVILRSAASSDPATVRPGW
ncbi:GHMP family kinase ATP-binding protein [Polymorphospora rubra]|uniref:GHMP family kinase ATP-binding protein n=1 Tax=Polymorphospora rubra TaxID=338584 RepID=UPI0033C184D1